MTVEPDPHFLDVDCYKGRNQLPCVRAICPTGDECFLDSISKLCVLSFPLLLSLLGTFSHVFVRSRLDKLAERVESAVIIRGSSDIVYGRALQSDKMPQSLCNRVRE